MRSVLIVLVLTLITTPNAPHSADGAAAQGQEAASESPAIEEELEEFVPSEEISADKAISFPVDI